jgi:hypothetical protein
MATNGKKFQIADAFKDLERAELAPGLSAGGFSRISMKDKIWKLIHNGETYQFIQDDGHPLPYLDMVIVGANPNTSKLFYPPGTYTQDASNPPTCASTDGDRPDPGVPIKQSESCHDCKHNQWKPNRGGKDCQDHRRLAVVLLPYMKTKPRLPAAVNTPVFFKVTPASLKSFKAYSDMLDDEDIKHYAAVITRVTFDTERQFQMNFEILQALTNAEAPAIRPLIKSAQVRSLIGGITELKQIEGKVPDLPRDTGLTSMFAPQQEQNVTPMATMTAKRPGRPRKAPEPEEIREAVAEQEGVPWDEPQDENLDKMMGEVLGKMMK